MARLPGAVSAQIVGSMTKANDLQATLVPGARRGLDLYLAGARIDELAAVPLDLYAAGLGLTKITPNSMGF